MGDAIGAVLPAAVGVAVSPIPIIAVILMLTSAKARVNGPAFVLGWLAGLGVVGAIVLLVAGSAGGGSTRAPSAWSGWLKLGLGLLLLVVAARQFRSRPRGDQEPEMPRWMARVDRISPLAAAGFAVALSAANPKNLLLAISAAASIVATGISGAQQAIAYVIFAVIASLSVGIPVGLYLVLGQRSQRMLAALKDWMSHNNAVIMAVLCLVFAAKLIGEAISLLT
ncbi:GAP family protein [Actinoplanes sp. TBRC 11911]|uniref:GAP family protein n=1 Tax=Actinoplanes sp. TBRC 11911 TaxID=2729386 RepID=UPI00145D5C95|nr:GAP family protein [Actinoplanes sp. TBRC 11911]NMO52858.1 GAP family protein [Actinoplanes sp. TBRC 11911]